MSTDLITHVSQLLDKELPFLLLRKSMDDEIVLLHQTNQILHESPHDTLSCGVFKKFQNEEDQYFIVGEVVKSFNWKIAGNKVKNKSIVLPNNQRDSHKNRVAAAVDAIKTTALDKVVLSLKFEADKYKSTTQILNNLLDSYPNANCYLFYHPHVGSWLGASPEVLISYKNSLLRTMSLAGTKRVVEGVDLPWSFKEFEEQKMVTDFITSSLKIPDVKYLKIGPQETINAGNLSHLQTLIEAQVNYKHLDKLLNILHPTPAVCGLPRDLALDFINSNEGYDRNFYTGYFGIKNPRLQTADYYVNLRCMELADDKIYLYAGGGITALSNPEDEVREIENKLGTMAALI